MGVAQLRHCFHKTGVTGVQVQVLVDVDPLDVLGVIPSLQTEFPDCLVRVIVIIHRNCLHPSVVRVPGVIHVAFEDLVATLEKLPYHFFIHLAPI
jgi:hypothetical protein